ncbi:MAG: hypothetical protein HYY29_02590, partial [Chloroflexi bacterium]|nr:hypothetical protein [Chloroflexota bacterium]
VPADVQSDVAETEIRRALKEARHISAISKEVEARPRPRLGGLTPEGLTPISALREYLKINNVAPERQKILLDYAQTLRGDDLQG